MRKRICTTSIFLALVGVAVLLCVVQIPDRIWWWSGYHGRGGGEPIVMWLLPNVMGPVFVAFSASVTIYGGWHLSSFICNKLRGEGG